MQSFLLISSAAFILASVAVGLRLLFLARRTGRVPERLMGAGLILLLLFYLPLMASTGMGRASVGEVEIAVMAFATPFMWVGITCLIAFTWKAFRPGASWAMVLTFVLSGFLATMQGGMLGSLLSSPQSASSFEACKLWTGLIRLPMIVNFAWTAYEGLHQYGLARRRQRLGLANPVVTNRFLLWGLIGITQVASMSLSLVFHVIGMGMMNSPISLFVLGLSSLVGSAMMTLALLPPKPYVAFIERRAAAQAG